MDLFAEVYNAAWTKNWGFVPFAKEDLDAYALGTAARLRPRMVHGRREREGEPIGVAITVPDVNQVLKKMNGRLLPFGWWHFLRKCTTIDRVRVGFLGVKPEYQHTGAAALLYVEHFDAPSARTQQRRRDGLDPGDNNAMNRGMEAMNGRVVKRYRVYERQLLAGSRSRLDAFGARPASSVGCTT